MSAGIRSYPSSWSCIAGSAMPISLSTDTPLIPASYALEVRDAIRNSVVYGPVALNTAAIPVIATQSRHAAENGYDWPRNAMVPSGLDSQTPTTFSCCDPIRPLLSAYACEGQRR